MIVLYIVAAIYGLSTAGYSIAVKQYLPSGKWVALISVFVLTVMAVIAQMLKPYYLVEMFSTSIGLPRPLSAGDFVRFMEARNRAGA